MPEREITFGDMECDMGELSDDDIDVSVNRLK